MDKPKKIPQHVAIIMDGNGRWARSRGLPKLAGHRAGVKAAEEAMKAAGELGIKVLTLYTFSTENWKRPRHEISALFKLLENYLERESGKLDENNIRFSVIGDMDNLPESVRTKLNKTIELTKKNTGLIVNLAFNYGSRGEIIQAVKHIANDIAQGKLSVDTIDEKIFSGYLYTKYLPDPDMLIRTSGEYRVSNFLLWQISYAELYVTKKLWPDFKKSDLKKAILEYQKRERRYGG
ncbi:MAG: isoprenyl transferase [Candidatus Omnitrophota bacterium]|jgi:undecaprenyl diphosphate synthase